MLTQTSSQYKQIITKSKSLFDKKNQDYGSSWRIMRLSSITDQIFIKAKRIRSIQEKGTQKIADDILSEFIGIINYCFIALMQIDLEKEREEALHLAPDLLSQMYEQRAEKNLELLNHKNHDYGEAWRDMRVSSMTDQILMKLLRIKQIEDNQGQTIVSEGVETIYQDIINYAVFCLIQSDFLTHEDHQ